MKLAYSKTLNELLQKEPPENLYHYTSPAGLIGMVQHREIWATNISFLNDVKELQRAVEIAKHRIDTFESVFKSNKLKYTEEDLEVLQSMGSSAGSAAKRIYIFSLSEERDQLSQWRAYCPNGGYAIGFPSTHLKKMADKQSFYLCPCVYEPAIQELIICEIILDFILEFRSRREAGVPQEEAVKKISWEFGQYLANYGPVIKDNSFYEEKEWRLISSQIHDRHKEINFRPGKNGIIPYFNFKVTDEEDPDLVDADCRGLIVVNSPTSDRFAASSALQSFLTKYVGPMTGVDSQIPYCNW